MKTIIAFLLFGGLQLTAQDMQSCPMHKEHMKEASQHQADVEKHGDEAMGFPHDKTTHHFRLYSDTAMVICKALSGTVSNNNAPKPEPMMVRMIEGSKRLRVRTPFLMNGKEPPTLIKVKASMLVATATWASMPRAIITGTVMRDVLPVTTLITLVRKNTATRVKSSVPDTRLS